MLIEAMMVKILYIASGAIFILSGMYCNYRQGDYSQSSMQIALGIAFFSIGIIQE
jgi:hypothetical protein